MVSDLRCARIESERSQILVGKRSRVSAFRCRRSGQCRHLTNIGRQSEMRERLRRALKAEIVLNERDPVGGRQTRIDEGFDRPEVDARWRYVQARLTAFP